MILQAASWLQKLKILSADTDEPTVGSPDFDWIDSVTKKGGF